MFDRKGDVEGSFIQSLKKQNRVSKRAMHSSGSYSRHLGYPFGSNNSVNRRAGKVKILINDCSGNRIMETFIESHLYIKQVKYDIYRSKFLDVTNPLDAFTLYHNGKPVDNTVNIGTLLESDQLILELKIDESARKYIEKKQPESIIENVNAITPFVENKDINGCFKLLMSNSMNDKEFSSAIDIAKKGFPATLYGKILFPHLHLLLESMCNTLKEPRIIVVVLQWYRLVIRDIKETVLSTILLDLQLVIYTYLSERNVVQNCVNTLILISDLSFSSDDLDIMCSTDFTYNNNNIIKLYNSELWISNFFQFLQQLVFTIKNTRVESFISSYHLSLLSSALNDNYKQPPIFQSLCSYFQSIADSGLPSIVLFNTDVLAILASKLQSSTINDAENTAAILRVFLSFARRKELYNMIIESNIISFFNNLINLFSSNRTIIRLALSLLQELVASQEICCYMYLMNLLDVFQTCLSVYRESEKNYNIEIIQSCYSIMYIMLRKNDIAIQYLNENDVDLVMSFFHYKEPSFISTLLKFITVIIQRKTFFELIRQKKYVRIFEDLQSEFASHKIISNQIQYILNKEAIDIPASEMVFDFPSQESVINTISDEQIMNGKKLYHLLCWRLIHSSNPILLEAAANALASILVNNDIGTETLQYLPACLIRLFTSVDGSVVLYKSVVTIQHVILSQNPLIPIPREFGSVLLKCVVDKIFNYHFVLKSLRIIEILHQQHPDFVQDEDVIQSLQIIQYATHSLQVRQLIDSLLKQVPTVSNGYGERSNNIELSIFDATIYQLTSKNPTVLTEALKLCANAMILSPTQFESSFRQENGYGKFMELLRTTDADEVLHPAFNLLSILIDNQYYRLSDKDILHLVAILYNLLRRREKCSVCISKISEYILRLSQKEDTIKRVMNNIDIITQLLNIYVMNGSNESESLTIVKNLFALLTLVAEKELKGIQTLRNKEVVPTLNGILYNVQDEEVAIPCLKLFFLLKGEQLISAPYLYLIKPCSYLIFTTDILENSTIFQLIQIFMNCLQYEPTFLEDPIHKVLTLFLGLLPPETLAGVDGDLIVNYITKLSLSANNHSIFILSGIIPKLILMLQSTIQTLNIESIINSLYFFSLVVSNHYIKNYLRSQLSLFDSLIHTFFQNDSVVELVLRIFVIISGSNDLESLKNTLERIQSSYMDHSDIMMLVELLYDKWDNLNMIGSTTSLQEACSYLLSSSENDFVSNLKVMLQIMNEDEVTITDIEVIATPFLEWIETCELIYICPAKVVELFNKILNLILSSSTELSIRFFSVYCFIVFTYFPDLKDDLIFQDVTSVLDSYLTRSSLFANDISTMFVGIILLALQEQTDMESVMLLFNDLITTDHFCSCLADVHFVDCLISFLDLYPDERSTSFVLSLLAYMISFESTVHYLTSKPYFTAVLSQKKQLVGNSGSEINLFLNQILNCIQNLPLEDELIKLVVDRYGELPDSVAPECTKL